MSEASEIDAPHDRLPTVAPTLKLSRRGLVFSLLAMIVAGLTVFANFPEAIDGESLPVQVTLGLRPVESADGRGAFMTDVLIIKNESDFEISRVGVKINSQYLLHREPPLTPHEELILPLQVFTDKRSSQRYNPQKYPPQEVLVTGQLPSGGRGLRHVAFDDPH